MDMECPDCGYSYAYASKALDPAVQHIDPYIEIGPAKGKTYKISLLWIDQNKDKGTI
jgi:hypothetical protein